MTTSGLFFSRKFVGLFSSIKFSRQNGRCGHTTVSMERSSSPFLQDVRRKHWDQCYRGPASSPVEGRYNWVYWTVGILWPGTVTPQEHKALVDSGILCALMPSSYAICISGVTGGCKQLGVLESEITLIRNECQKHAWTRDPTHPWHSLSQERYFRYPKG